VDETDKHTEECVDSCRRMNGRTREPKSEFDPYGQTDEMAEECIGSCGWMDGRENQKSAFDPCGRNG
jgi:hypothetical protein